MAKSLNDVLKGVNKSKDVPGSTGSEPGIDYAPKSKGDQDFVALHKTQKHEDRVGNGDDVYNASKVKKAKMERHGHDPDPKAKKIYQQANEAKDEGEYGYEGDMAISQLKSIMRNASQLMGLLKPDTDLPEWVQSKITLANDYVDTAANYMMSEMSEARMCEACGKSGSSCSCGSDKDDQPKYNGKKKLLLDRKKLQEVLTKKTSVGEVISDFVHSKDPKFEGKSKAERQKMALGAYYGMHPEKSKKTTNEEVEQIDEISPALLKKARDMAVQKNLNARTTGNAPRATAMRTKAYKFNAAMEKKIKNEQADTHIATPSTLVGDTGRV